MSGNLRLNGGTSGYSELRAPDDAGDQVFLFPLTGGTLMTTNDIISPDGLWTRTGTTISPSNPGDDLDGIGTITAAGGKTEIRSSGTIRKKQDATSDTHFIDIGTQADSVYIQSTSGGTATPQPLKFYVKEGNTTTTHTFNTDGSVEFDGSITAAGKVQTKGANSAYFESDRTDSNTLTFQGMNNGVSTFRVKAGGSINAAGSIESTTWPTNGYQLEPGGVLGLNSNDGGTTNSFTIAKQGTQTLQITNGGSITAAGGINASRTTTSGTDSVLYLSSTLNGTTTNGTFYHDANGTTVMNPKVDQGLVCNGSAEFNGSVNVGENADWAGDVKIAARTAGSNWGLTTAHDSTQANPNGLLCATGNATPSGASIRVEFDHPGLGGSGNKTGFSVDWDGGFSSSQGNFSVNTAGIIHNPAGYGYTVGNGPRAVQIDDNGRMGGLPSVRASKKNIQYDYDSSWVQDLKPSTFNYRIRNEAGAYTTKSYERTEYGLIAEDVEQVNPLICNYDFDDKLVGVEYARLITPLVAELQKAVNRIQTLEAEVAALKS